MPVIDPDGLFGGDRIAWLSDKAKLYWPWFFLASNNYARLELNYRKIRDWVFGRFHAPLSERDFWELVREYHDNFLLFVYRANDQLWGQWDTSERLLFRYKTAKDRRSPAPPGEKWLEWKNQYFQKKIQQGPVVAIIPEKFCVGVGVGVGEGVGDGEGVLPPNPLLQKLPNGHEAASPNGSAENSPKKPRKRTSRTQQPPEVEKVINGTGERIYDRHPAKRRCSFTVITTKLRIIVAPLPTIEAKIEMLRMIDQNHEGWCATDDWVRGYAPGLEKWLNPVKAYYELPPPIAASEPDLLPRYTRP